MCVRVWACLWSSFLIFFSSACKGGLSNWSKEMIKQLMCGEPWEYFLIKVQSIYRICHMRIYALTFWNLIIFITTKNVFFINFKVINYHLTNFFVTRTLFVLYILNENHLDLSFFVRGWHLIYIKANPIRLLCV